MPKLPTYKTPRDEFGDRHVKTDDGGIHLTPKRMRLAQKVACAECPLRRDSAPGYLGGYSPEMYIDVLHGPASIACHKFLKNPLDQQHVCTGVAAFRANVGHVCKINGHITGAQDSTDFVGPDRENFFASDAEFLAHHRNKRK